METESEAQLKLLALSFNVDSQRVRVPPHQGRFSEVLFCFDPMFTHVSNTQSEKSS